MSNLGDTSSLQMHGSAIVSLTGVRHQFIGQLKFSKAESPQIHVHKFFSQALVWEKKYQVSYSAGCGGAASGGALFSPGPCKRQDRINSHCQTQPSDAC